MAGAGRGAGVFLETIAMRGKANLVRAIADHLICTRGVRHGQLVSTTTGEHLH